MRRRSRPPRRAPSSGSAAVTSRVIRWKPRARGSRAISRCVHITGPGRGLAVGVAHLVVEAEERAQAAAAREALGGAELARVGVEDDVGLPVRADRQEAHELAGVVVELVGALLAGREAQDVAGLQPPPPLGRAQRGPSVEDDEQLLLGEVEVVRVRALAGIDLPEAGADALAAELVAEPGAARAE